jgi:O-antigen chain-terminating methyltransferase
LRTLVHLRHIERTLGHLQDIERELQELRYARFEMDRIHSRLNRIDVLDIANRLHRLDVMGIPGRLYRLEKDVEESSIQNRLRDNRIATLTQQLNSARLTTLHERNAVKNTTEISNDYSGIDRQSDVDGFYKEFEDRFRGTREDIAKRLEVYLPYIKPYRSIPDAKAVDIGCGRGEWLEHLLKENISGTGIDLNVDMVQTCRSLGLDAACQDAVKYLHAQPKGSLAIITGFHIIEHMSFDELLSLFDAALYALRDDGVVIFETPNPENLLVGAYSFHFDLTHRHPIAPVIAEFIARQRGFARTEILRLHPYPKEALLDDGGAASAWINRHFYNAQDYALIAWKQNVD